MATLAAKSSKGSTRQSRINVLICRRLDFRYCPITTDIPNSTALKAEIAISPPPAIEYPLLDVLPSSVFVQIADADAGVDEEFHPGRLNGPPLNPRNTLITSLP